MSAPEAERARVGYLKRHKLFRYSSWPGYLANRPAVPDEATDPSYMCLLLGMARVGWAYNLTRFKTLAEAIDFIIETGKH